MTPSIDTNFPGGNGEWIAFDETTSTLVLRPELRGGSPHRGWFHVRIDHLTPGRATTLRVVENCWAGVYSYSDTNRDDWRHFTDYRQDSRTDYSFFFTPARDSLYVAMMAPYRQNHLDRLIAQTTGDPRLTVTNFWTSEEGYAGKRFTIGAPDAPRRAWFTARMHAFEAVSSWTADGLIRWALSEDPDAQWLLANTTLNVVPMVDVDAVHMGSSGKHRTPICFARDARVRPHWNAIRALVNEWKTQGPPTFFMDLHGPGGECTAAYFYAPQPVWTTPQYERDLSTFCDLLAPALPKVMRYKKFVYRCPLGPDDQQQDMAGTSYCYLHHRYFGDGPLRLAIASETPWTVPGYTTDVFAACGAAYGKAVSRLLRTDRR